MSINNQIPKRQERAEKLLKSIQAWLNEQPEYENPNAGTDKPLRLIEPTDRFRLGNMLDELEHLTNLFQEKLINEKLLNSRDDFLDAIKSNLIRRTINSLTRVQVALKFAMEYLSNQDKPISSSKPKTTPTETNIEYSLPLKMTQWAKIFHVSENKLRELRDEGKYHFERLSARKWRLPKSELPAEYLEKYRPS
jgi:hypothetical protein